MEVLERKTRSKSVGCTPANQEPLAEIITHTKNKYAAIHADIKKMRENKNLSLREVMAKIQVFLSTWTKEELLTLVRVKIDQEIIDKYNIVVTQKELKGCRQIIKALNRDNSELKRVIASCEHVFAELNSEEVYLCPRTRLNLTPIPQNSLNIGYEIAITKKFHKMKELDQFNLSVEPHQTLDKPCTSNLFILERLIKQLECCVAKRKQAQSSMKLKRRLIQECFQRFPKISLGEKNNACHLWSAKKVFANKPVKIHLQGTMPVVKAGNEKIPNEVGDLQDNFKNSSQIHPAEDDTPARLNSQEMETGKIIDPFKSEDVGNVCKNTPTNVKSEIKTPVIESVKYRKGRNIYPLRKKLDAKIKVVEKTKPTKLTVGINDASPSQEVLLKAESQSDSSQQKPTATNLPFPDFLKSQDCLSGGTSYYKKIQRIIRPRGKTTNIGNKSILLPNRPTGLENIDLAKQSSILNNLLRLNSDAALKALNEHHPIDKIDYRSVVDDSSDTSVSQIPADISIKSECPSPTRDAHNITSNVSNAPSKSTDVVNCCEQITLSTKPSRYHEADMSPLVKEANLAPAFKIATKDLNNPSKQDVSWAPVKIYHEEKSRTLKKIEKKTEPVVVSPVYQNYTRFHYDKGRTMPRSRINIEKAVDKDHPYSNRLINVHLQPIPMEVDLASDAANRQPAPTFNRLNPFTISPQIASTQMDTVDKKHKADDSTLGLGVNGLPIKKIKLSFTPFQTSQNNVKIAEDSVNFKVKTPIKCYSRNSSPKRNYANMLQLTTVVPQNSMYVDKVRYLTEIDGSKVDTTALQAKTEEYGKFSLSQVGDNMPQIVSVTSLPQSQAAPILGTDEPQTNSGNDSAKAGPPIKVLENLPQWCVQLLTNPMPKQVKIIAPRTQAELNVSQTQVEMDTQLETITPQTQRVPLYSPQSQMVPLDSPQSQIAPLDSQPSKMVPTNLPQTQVVPPDSPQSQMVPPEWQQTQITPLDTQPSQMVPLDSQQSQMVPQDSQQSQMVPLDSQQSQMVPQDSQQSQIVPLDSQQSQMVPQDSQQSQMVPLDSQQSQIVPLDSQQSQMVPLDSQQSQMVPQDLQQSQMVPLDSQQSQRVPQDSQQSQMVPQDSQQSQMVPLDSQQSQMVPLDSQQSQMVPLDSQQSQIVPLDTQQSQMVPLDSQQSQMVPQDSQQMVPTNRPQTEMPNSSQSQSVPTNTQQTQVVPPDSQQIQTIPPDSQQTQMVPPDSLQSQMVPTNTSQNQVTPLDLPQSQVVPPDSQPTQIALPDLQPSQMIPPDSQQSQLVPTNTPQTQMVSPVSRQTQMLTANTPQTQIVPPDSQQTQLVPMNTPQNQMVSPVSPQTQVVPPDSPQSQMLPPESQQSQIAPLDSQTSQMVPPDSQQSQMVPPDSQQSQLVPTNTPQTQMVSPVSQQTQMLTANTPQTQMDPPDSQQTQTV